MTAVVGTTGQAAASLSPLTRPILEKQVGKEHGTWGQRACPSFQDLAKVLATQGQEGIRWKSQSLPQTRHATMPGLYPRTPLSLWTNCHFYR